MARKLALLLGLVVAVVLIPAVPALADYTPPSSVAPDQPAVQAQQVVVSSTTTTTASGTLPVTGAAGVEQLVKVGVVLVAGGALVMLAVTMSRRRSLA